MVGIASDGGIQFNGDPSGGFLTRIASAQTSQHLDGWPVALVNVPLYFP